MRIPRTPFALAITGALLLVACSENTGAADAVAATPAAGGGQACVSSYSATMFGERVQEHSCIENVSQSQARFRQGCEETAAMGQEMADSGIPGVEIHDQSLEYATRCPSNPIGTCRGVGGGEVHFHYYQHPDADSLPQGCALLGGEWQG